MNGLLLQSFLDHIRTLVDTSVIKYNYLAKANETAESLKYADYYMAVYNKRDSFDSYPTFEIAAIKNAGKDFYRDPSAPRGTKFTTTITANMMAMNPKLIPSEYKDKVLNAQRQLILDGYDAYGDRNNYYRMLSGFPDLGTPISDYIELTDEQCERFGLDKPQYIHKVSDNIIHKLELSGELKTIQDANPDKKYLHYLGANRIPVALARSAKNFELLRVGADVPDQVYDTFIRLYEQNRFYVASTLYNSSMASAYDYYDNFMALLIMVMTIQRMVSTTFKKAIQRDLYDWTFIQNLYASYNIPFIENLSMDTQISIVKNFNLFLRYKGTDKVLFDICSILGHPEITINQYYFVKKIKRDEDHNPIFSDNPSDMYDMEFRSIDMREENVATALQAETTVFDYDHVTNSDPYFFETQQLKNEFLMSEFNYMESKYISLNIMVNMTDILLDFTYAFRLLLDKKSELSANDITIDLPRISDTKSYNIFDAVVFLIALICKRYNFEGTIPDASTIVSLYGLDFSSETINTLGALVKAKAELLKNPSKEDSEITHNIGNLYEYFTTNLDTKFEINSDEDINRIYTEIRDVRNLLTERMRYTDSVDEYYTCKQIYDTLLISDYTDSMFAGVDTYSDYIESIGDPEMLYYLTGTEATEAELNTAIEHVVSRFEALISDSTSLYYINSKTGPVYEAIIKLINFFKSYTVQLHTFNIWYVMSDKYQNMIRTIDKLGHLDSEIRPKGYLAETYFDSARNNSLIKPHDDLHTYHAARFEWVDNDERI